VALEARRLGPISINVRITAVRKLAVEAADNGFLAPELASGIARIKGVRTHGVRVGNWLSLQQAQALLNAPDIRTKKGLRDRAMFAVLLGCGLRRSELASLVVKHIQMRDSRWCIVDLVGKHGRVRTVPMPTWTKNALDAWTAVASISEGYVFRPITRGDRVHSDRLSEKVVWQMLKSYVARIGVPHARLMISVEQLRSCAGPLAVNLNKSRCYSGIRQFKRPSIISGRNRIWRMRQMMGSN
jgi:integrase